MWLVAIFPTLRCSCHIDAGELRVTLSVAGVILVLFSLSLALLFFFLLHMARYTKRSTYPSNESPLFGDVAWFCVLVCLGFGIVTSQCGIYDARKRKRHSLYVYIICFIFYALYYFVKNLLMENCKYNLYTYTIIVYNCMGRVLCAPSLSLSFWQVFTETCVKSI